MTVEARAPHTSEQQAERPRRFGMTPWSASPEPADQVSLAEGITSEASTRFQVLSNFLALEASRVRRSEGLAVSSALEEVRARVLAVARLHDWTARASEPPDVDFGAVLDRIRENLSSTSSAGGPSLSCAAYGRRLPASQCVWPALIASELVSSALKYGFIDHLGGRISVFFVAGPAAWILEVEDSGSPWRAPGSRRGAGMLVVQALVESLDGRLEVAEVLGGNRCKVIMPLMRLAPVS